MLPCKIWTLHAIREVHFYAMWERSFRLSDAVERILSEFVGTHRAATKFCNISAQLKNDSGLTTRYW
jgi:hypothetical protein